MPTLRGLPNTEGEVEARTCLTYATARKWILRGHAVTGAGADGAYNVWRDDRGCWCGSLCRWGVEVDSTESMHVQHTIRWLRGAIPEIGNVRQLAESWV